MIIPEDGCLKKITRTGFAAFNNVMIIKVPEKYRKPNETLYQLATLDRTKKGEKWPADKYIDGSNPEVEPIAIEHNELGKDINTKVNNSETKISINSQSSRVNGDEFQRNKTLQTYSERVPAINVDTLQPETPQIIQNNVVQPFSLPVFNPPFLLSEYPKFDGLLGERPPPNSLFTQETNFDLPGPEHVYNRRMPIGTNFQKGKNFNHNRNYPNDISTDKPFDRFPRNNFVDDFTQVRKYNNLHQNRPLINDLHRDRFRESRKPTFENPHLNNCPPIQDVIGNDYIEPQYVDSHKYPMGPPNHLNGHVPFQPAPRVHSVKPLNPIPFAKPPESAYVRPFRDHPDQAGLALIPERNLPSDINFSGASNRNYGSDLFPPHSYNGIQRNLPSFLDDNLNRMNHLDSMTNNGFRRDYDQLRDNCPTADFSRRNPHQYNNEREIWGGPNNHEPLFNEPYREREGVAPRNNFKFRNQQSWKNRPYNARGRRDHRNRYNNNNNRNKMNEKKS